MKAFEIIDIHGSLIPIFSSIQNQWFPDFEICPRQEFSGSLKPLNNQSHNIARYQRTCSPKSYICKFFDNPSSRGGSETFKTC
jgi:hypothetical protein